MIGYYGYRGSGKTLNLVADIWKEFKRDPNLIVLTNTPLTFPVHPRKGTRLRQFVWTKVKELEDYFRFAITDSDLVLANRSIVIIDEANLVLPSRLFASMEPFMLSFMAESRKLNTDIYFTTQHPLRVDKVLRELTEFWVHCVRIPLLNFVKMHDEDLTPDGQVVETFGLRWRFRMSAFYGFYNTHHIVGMDDSLLPEADGDTGALHEFLASAYGNQPGGSEDAVGGNSEASGRSSFYDWTVFGRDVRFWRKSTPLQDVQNSF